MAADPFLARRKFRQNFKHGTYARYVAKCRCDDCRRANRDYVQAREDRSREAALELEPQDPVRVERPWTHPSGAIVTRVYPGCPGLPQEEACPNGRILRKDSTGGICRDCRMRLSFNGNVDAGPARRHLRKLARKGCGYKQVAAASGVAESICQAIRRGTRKQIRQATLDRLLEVDADARADTSKVPAARTQAMLRILEAEFLTKKALARALGQVGGKQPPSLQISKVRVYASTEKKVERLYRRTMGEDYHK